jgi:predicted aldo/keto reductase-like oxidoreductase
MQYTLFGRSGVKVSRLGFGCMRLPMRPTGGEVDTEAAVQLLQNAVKLGVNYFDSAYFYHDGQSERLLGQAVKGMREQVVIATKSPGGYNKKPGDYRRLLEEQLTRLDTSYIDFYHFHGATFDRLYEIDKRSDWINAALKARDEGLVKYLSFSFHGDANKPDDLKNLVDTGLFHSVLCQYNVIDRKNEEGMAYAKEKGLGIAVMGPLAGGVVAGLPETVAGQLGIPAASSAELGLRFVAANPHVDILVSGMSAEKQLTDNAAYAARLSPLSEEETRGINELMARYRKMADLYCTGCRYCMPCPQQVEIPYLFELANYHNIYEMHGYAKEKYAAMAKEITWAKGFDACNQCGECEPKCPQKIEIRKQLKETDLLLRKV